ncbi:hypothetical protein VTK73DRAFT_10351 [Phialemonium thermophilum]|uniref:E3 ubiquitin-protein ligase listerin n=1 Tax=Phialemonium thermophilum TaxID=223376 RepID=A0ABR3XGM3_9PEZI
MNARATGLKGFGPFSTSTANLSYISEPPNFGAVSDPKVVVSLKNLLKKDSTTKSKALEDLVAYVQTHPFEQDGGVEDGILDVWVQLYPRSSIDDSRRVRELSHILQLELLKSARRRMEKRIPHVVGAWLTGTFDRDRVVSRAASDGLSFFLKTEEKTTQFWKRCSQQIAQYALDAIQETPDTLSDERSTTVEDAKAKYYRVVAGSISLILNLLQRLGTDVPPPQVEQFLDLDVVWAMAAAEDPLVRRCIYRLVYTCLTSQHNLLSQNLPQVGKALISEALRTSQRGGSAADLLQTLTELTRRHPEVWGTKKQPLTRLQDLVGKGSQGSSRVFWDELDRLVAVLPLDVVNSQTGSKFLETMRLGISSREEPRANAPYSWACYIHIFQRLLDQLPPEESGVEFVKRNFFPLTESYLFPSPDTSAGNSSLPVSLLSKAWVDIASRPGEAIQKSISAEWQKLSEELVSRVAGSLPEVSADYRKSQQSVADAGDRWFTLVSLILEADRREDEQNNSSDSLAPLLSETSIKILQDSTSFLVKRNYKPLLGASILRSALTKCLRIFTAEHKGLLLSLVSDTESQRPKTLIESPSAPIILPCLHLLSTVPTLSDTYKALWNVLIQHSVHLDSPEAIGTVTMLISSEAARPLAHGDSQLQHYVLDKCIQTAKGKTDAWQMFEAALTYGILDESYTQSLASGLMDLLEDSSQPQDAVIRGVQLVADKLPLVWCDSERYLRLLTRLISLEETSSPMISGSIVSVRRSLEKYGNEGPQVVTIIQQNLDGANSDSMDVDTLIQHAVSVSGSGKLAVEAIFPNTNVWMDEMLSFLTEPPNPSLSVTSSFSGGYSLALPSTTSKHSKSRRDRNGRAIPARMAMYTLGLLQSGLDISSLPRTYRTEILCLLAITVELASDQLTLMEEGKLWATLSAESTVQEMETFVQTVRRMLQGMVSSARGWMIATDGGDEPLNDLLQILLQQSKALSLVALYSAKALSYLLLTMTEAYGFSQAAEEAFVRPELLKADPNSMFAALGLITGFGHALTSSALLTRLCNGLIAEVMGSAPSSAKCLFNLVLLNACMSAYEAEDLPIENRKQAIAVQKITSWTETSDATHYKLAAEISKALNCLLPNVKTIHGPYWEQAIRYCILLWDKAREDSVNVRLPYLHASLKLFATLKGLAGSNEDLDEALTTLSEETTLALIELLEIPRVSSNQPSQIVDSLLCRLVEEMPLEHLQDKDELYGLVASESREIQTAAFSLLHRALPAAQEQLNYDAILEKQDSRLPDELLSLLVDAPTLDNFADELPAHFPAPVRSYLLAWHLIFDAFQAASFKVRNDYIDNLRSLNNLAPLLDFAFDVLGHSAARALNLDKAGFSPELIRAFDLKLADAETEERELQWLLVHLIYLTLKYIPGLFKAWFLDCRSKQTKIAVEGWMTKFMSPLLIEEAVEDVQKWAAEQEPDEDGREMWVKVSKLGREITAGYEVDELQASIAIRIPAAYPLETVSVVGVNRVAANEKTWQSWLMTTQGVITFSNGSIVDGLSAFRRNAFGALKGQTECAICYSIVSTDKRIPDKKCGTCKKLFHRTCLYKWFQTSNQNSCPLCRNPIDFIGSDMKSRRGGER